MPILSDVKLQVYSLLKNYYKSTKQVVHAQGHAQTTHLHPNEQYVHALFAKLSHAHVHSPNLLHAHAHSLKFKIYPNLLHVQAQSTNLLHAQAQSTNLLHAHAHSPNVLRTHAHSG